jgi:hypothetical protein
MLENDHLEPRAVEVLLTSWLARVMPSFVAGNTRAIVGAGMRSAPPKRATPSVRYSLSQRDRFESLGAQAFAGFGVPQQEESEFMLERGLVGPGFAHQVPTAVRKLVVVELVDSVRRQNDVGEVSQLPKMRHTDVGARQASDLPWVARLTGSFLK